MTEFDDDDDRDELSLKSKSQVKREVEALQKLGERLTELNAEQLARIPLEHNLLAAVKEYKRLNKNEAKRRQRQYLGRLMRNVDAAAIAEAVARFDASKAAHTRHFHGLERWRDRLLTEPQSVTEFVNEYPQVDSQHLRQLVRNAAREREQNMDRGGARKLFRYIREVAEES